VLDATHSGLVGGVGLSQGSSVSLRNPGRAYRTPLGFGKRIATRAAGWPALGAGRARVPRQCWGSR
jgi:hypothetical protein